MVRGDKNPLHTPTDEGDVALQRDVASPRDIRQDDTCVNKGSLSGKQIPSETLFIKQDTIQRSGKTSKRKRNVLVFVLCVLIWLVLDILTKGFFNAFDPGELIGGPFAGIFEFRLVHNTGAAWGMFANSTFILGVVSLVVCVLLVVYLFVLEPQSSLGSTIGLALVCAGGVGNALDRFTLGYVVDFIAPVFIDFPVFNVADIGVTCGIVIFLISLLFTWFRSSQHE